jgi:hypothetical protein
MACHQKRIEGAFAHATPQTHEADFCQQVSNPEKTLHGLK